MKRFVEGEDRRQGVLLPEYLDDFVAEENQVRVIEAFVDELDLRALWFEGVVPEATGRPAYHPATMLKIYVYGYVNQIASSRRLEREAQRNVEMMWLTGRLAPDFKTIADFRKDNGAAIRATCRAIRGALPKSELVHSGDRGDRRKPVQGRQLPRQIVLARLD
jgi:transposase